MTFFEIFFTIIGALLVGLLFFYLFRSTGPWGSLWTFLLILILAGITAEIWIPDAGPVMYDVAWAPTLFVIFLFALLLAAAAPPRRRINERDELEDTRDESVVALGAFFWILMLFFLFAILIGILV